MLSEIESVWNSLGPRQLDYLIVWALGNKVLKPTAIAETLNAPGILAAAGRIDVRLRAMAEAGLVFEKAPGEWRTKNVWHDPECRKYMRLINRFSVKQESLGKQEM